MTRAATKAYTAALHFYAASHTDPAALESFTRSIEGESEVSSDPFTREVLAIVTDETRQTRDATTCSTRS